MKNIGNVSRPSSRPSSQDRSPLKESTKSRACHHTSFISVAQIPSAKTELSSPEMQPICAIHLEVFFSFHIALTSGLGLTGGMLDAGCLADAFEGIYNENQPDSILTKYSDIRREIYQKYTDPWSQENVRRLFTLDPETAHEDPFMKAVEATSVDEETRKAFIDRPQLLRVDIRDYFVKN
jgi:hypothetical protein